MNKSDGFVPATSPFFSFCYLDHGGFVCLFVFLKMGTCWPRIQNSSYPASRVLGSKACTSRHGLYGTGKGPQDPEHARQPSYQPGHIPIPVLKFNVPCLRNLCVIFISFSWSFLGWPPGYPTSPTWSKQVGTSLASAQAQAPAWGQVCGGTGDRLAVLTAMETCLLTPLQRKQDPLPIPEARWLCS